MAEAGTTQSVTFPVNFCQKLWVKMGGCRDSNEPPYLLASKQFPNLQPNENPELTLPGRILLVDSCREQSASLSREGIGEPRKCSRRHKSTYRDTTIEPRL